MWEHPQETVPASLQNDALQEGYADMAKGNAAQSAAAAHCQALGTHISTKQTFWNIYLG